MHVACHGFCGKYGGLLARHLFSPWTILDQFQRIWFSPSTLTTLSKCISEGPERADNCLYSRDAYCTIYTVFCSIFSIFRRWKTRMKTDWSSVAPDCALNGVVIVEIVAVGSDGGRAQCLLPGVWARMNKNDGKWVSVAVVFIVQCSYFLCTCTLFCSIFGWQLTWRSWTCFYYLFSI